MAMIDKTHLYDALKAPFRGHALSDLLIKNNSKYEFYGSASFSNEEEYHKVRFRDTTASEEMKEVDPWTGESKNTFTWEQVKDEVPTWDEIEAEHLDNLAEYETYSGKRARKYPDVKNQLDMLYKDINNGLLGDAAKESTFYTTIKAIKDANQ
jgi:hypothetical protein